MKTQAIGEIQYIKYSERVLLDETFNFDELLNIVLNDKDFVSFHVIFNDKIVASTGNALIRVFYTDGVTIFDEIGVLRQLNDKSRFVLTNYLGQEIDLHKDDILKKERITILSFGKFERDEKILGHDWSIYSGHTYKKKVTFTVNGHPYKTKIEAIQTADQMNEKVKSTLDNIIQTNLWKLY